MTLVYLNSFLLNVSIYFPLKSINGLIYNKVKNKFTLKVKDKKTNTLKSLAPKNKTQNKNPKKNRRRKKSKIDSNLKE